MKVELLKHNASDLDVVNAARVSYSNRHEEMQPGDDKLLGFLMRERHGTPFEHGYFQFLVEAPIFVFREWHRHRVGHSYNEMSGRYVEMRPTFYAPGSWRMQEGKPGHYEFHEIGHDSINEDIMQQAFRVAWASYQSLLARGVAKEQARAVLPLGIYSEMIWSCNPRSLMHFLGLRNAPNALKEIRNLAEMAEGTFERVMPITSAAFIANGRTAP